MRARAEEIAAAKVAEDKVAAEEAVGLSATEEMIAEAEENALLSFPQLSFATSSLPQLSSTAGALSCSSSEPAISYLS